MAVNNDETDFAVWHSALDAWPPSMWKIRTVAHANGGWDELLFPIIKYHSRWRGIGAEDFSSEPSGYFGYRCFCNRNPQKWDNVRVSGSCSLPSGNEEKLRQIISACNEYGAKLVLLISPYDIGGDRKFRELMMRRFNRVKEIATAFSVPVLDLFENLESFDLETDFYDSGHLNASGSVKAMRHIGGWLESHFTLNTNHTEDVSNKWRNELDRYGKERITSM